MFWNKASAVAKIFDFFSKLQHIEYRSQVRWQIPWFNLCLTSPLHSHREEVRPRSHWHLGTALRILCVRLNLLYLLTWSLLLGCVKELKWFLLHPVMSCDICREDTFSKFTKLQGLVVIAMTQISPFDQCKIFSKLGISSVTEQCSLWL